MEDWNRGPIHGSSTGHLVMCENILLITATEQDPSHPRVLQWQEKQVQVDGSRVAWAAGCSLHSLQIICSVS